MRNPAPFVKRRLSMTPLIDVIFLLLLFFMLSSTFSKFGEIQLNQATPGASGQSSDAKRSFVQIGAERLAVNGAETDLAQVAQAIEAGQVLISMDPGTSAQRLVDLLVELRGRADLNVTVLE